MRDGRTVLGIGGFVALVAVGVLAASLVGAGGAGVGGDRSDRSDGDGSANGAMPVRGVEQLTGSWRSVNDASAPAPVVGTVVLEFLDDGQMLVGTGCNSMSGPVSVDDSVLVTSELITTLIGCPPALAEQESWVTEMLQSRPRLEQSGPYLYLHWGQGEQWWLGLEREGEGETSPPTIPAS